MSSNPRLSTAVEVDVPGMRRKRVNLALRLDPVFKRVCKATSDIFCKVRAPVMASVRFFEVAEPVNSCGGTAYVGLKRGRKV